MSKRPVKHVTTPRPKWHFFRSKNLRNDENKSEGTCSKDPVHLDKVEKVKGRINDPYSFPSDTSWSFEDDVGTDLSWTSLGSDIDSDDDIQIIDSVFYTPKTKDYDFGNPKLASARNEDNATSEFSSPEIMRFQDRDDNIQFRNSVLNSAEIKEYDFGNPKLASARNEGSGNDVIFERFISATRRKKFGSPALTSTRNEGNDKDVVCLESTINGTKSSFSEKGNFIDSRCGDAKNSYSQLPAGIDDVNNFVKSPPFPDVDYEVKYEDIEVHEESLIPISLKTFVNEEDKGHISKFSEGKSSPEMECPSFHRYFENIEDLQHTTTVNSSDDGSFEGIIHNDTSDSKMNVAIFQLTSTEESQEEKWNEYERKPLESLPVRPLSKNETFSDIKRGKYKRRRYVKPKNASVAENQGSNSNQKKQKSQNWWKRRKRPHQRKTNKTGSDIAKHEENVEDLRTSEVPLSRSTTPFTDNKGSVTIKEEGHITLSTSVTENPDSNLNQKRRKRSRRRKKNKTGSNIAQYEEHAEDLRAPEVTLSRSTAPSADSKTPVSVEEEGGSKPKIKRQRKYAKKNKEKWNKYKKYLKSLPICDLNIKKSLSDTEWGEKEKEGKSKRNNKRCRKQTKRSKEKWNEKKKYLESLPICPLSKNKDFSDIKWEDNKSGITCLSIKKELD